MGIFMIEITFDVTPPIRNTRMSFNNTAQLDPVEDVVRLESYAQAVVVPASLLFAQPTGLNKVAMESFATLSEGLLEELGIRKNSIAFTIKETTTAFTSMFSSDATLNRKLAKVPFTNLMDLPILNPMGLKGSLTEYGHVLVAASELCLHIILQTIPQAKVFYAEVLGNAELGNSRPIPALGDLRLNTEEVTGLKLAIKQMLDSKYQNPTVTFGTQFKRVKDWNETEDVTAKMANNLKKLEKLDIRKVIKSLLPLIDKLIVRATQKSGDKAISDVNINVLKDVTRNIADEIAFVGAICHLTDTYVRVMEENKEQLRSYLT